MTCCVQLAERCSRRYRARNRRILIVNETHPAANARITQTLCLPRAGWISMLLLEWLRKPCNHPAQGLTAGWSGFTCCGMYPPIPGIIRMLTTTFSRCPICDSGQFRQRACSNLSKFRSEQREPVGRSHGSGWCLTYSVCLRTMSTAWSRQRRWSTGACRRGTSFQLERHPHGDTTKNGWPQCVAIWNGCEGSVRHLGSERTDVDEA